MKNVFCTIAFLFLMLSGTRAEDLRKVINLSGTWKFSIGDNMRWADPKFDDTDWDHVRVPSKWEDQGYEGYNGYAWYRKRFTVHEISGDETLFLILGWIDDSEEVYLNGKLIAKNGDFPPDFETAHDKERKLKITDNILKIGQTNTIAIRVYDSYLEGGIKGGNPGIYIDEDEIFLDYKLSGNWKFHLGDNKQWKEENYDDYIWESIKVPGEWEQQGYEGYDGFGWYRINFRLPSTIDDSDLYLSLGKIDDIDYVYLNGELIGTVYELKKDGDYRRNGMEYNARRIYEIPEGLIRQNGMNTIAIRVFDLGHRGGIYQGPVGIMEYHNFKRYYYKYSRPQPFWDYIYENFLED